jgi:hypothetical protein
MSPFVFQLANLSREHHDLYAKRTIYDYFERPSKLQWSDRSNEKLAKIFSGLTMYEEQESCTLTCDGEAKTFAWTFDTDTTYLEGDLVKLWVFQPSGVCQPLKVHVERDSSTFDVEFAALTADIVKESVDLR